VEWEPQRIFSQEKTSVVLLGSLSFLTFPLPTRPLVLFSVLGVSHGNAALVAHLQGKNKEQEGDSLSFFFDSGKHP